MKVLNRQLQKARDALSGVLMSLLHKNPQKISVEQKQTHKMGKNLPYPGAVRQFSEN